MRACGLGPRPRRAKGRGRRPRSAAGEDGDDVAAAAAEGNTASMGIERVAKLASKAAQGVCRGRDRRV